MELISLLASLFAAFITIGYFIKPRLKFCVCQNETQWRVKLCNKNILPVRVKDIKCEVALSKTDTFQIANTLRLRKDWIVFLKTCPDFYLFLASKNQVCRSHDNTNAKIEYNFLRVRILAPNFLGVKKSYENVYALKDIIIEDCNPFK